MEDRVACGNTGFDGVHQWTDRYGNCGAEVVSQRQIRVRTTRSDGLFDVGYQNPESTLAKYFSSERGSRRRILVVIDQGLPNDKRSRIEAYFEHCKTEKLLDDYLTVPCIANETEKTLGTVMLLISAAKRFRLRRRDLFVAIGGTITADIVGFTAAIYRRATPYILVPTDIIGIVHSLDTSKKASLNQMGGEVDLHKGTITLSHFPVSSFFDAGLLGSLDKDEVRRGVIEMIKIAVVKDYVLFSYIESRLDEMFVNNPRTHLMTAIQRAAQRVNEAPGTILWVKEPANFGGEVVRAMGQIKGMANDHVESVVMGITLMSTVSFVMGYLSGGDLERMLNLLAKAGFPTWTDKLAADVLWERITHVVKEIGEPAIIVPTDLSTGKCIGIIDISPGHLVTAVNFLRTHRTLNTCQATTSTVGILASRESCLLKRWPNQSDSVVDFPANRVEA